jgi:Flp pilus assembly protein TadD
LRRVLAAVFLAALGLRLLNVWQLVDAPVFLHLMGDAKGYDEWAQRLAAGDWLGTGVFYQAPFYPYLLGALYAVLGRNLLLVRVVQAVAGAAASVLVAAAGAQWFGRRAGIVAGLLLAVYAPAIFFDALIQKSVLDGLLVAGLLLALAGRDLGIGRAAGVGALAGLLALCRENALALVPVLVAVVWLRSHRRWLAAAATVAGTVLVLVPVAVRNVAVGGELHLSTFQLGSNFYIGNSAQATGTYVPLRPDHGSFVFERQDAVEMAEAAAGRRLRPSEVSRYWLSKGIEWIRSSPGAWLALTWRKTLLLLNYAEAADTEDLLTYAGWSLPLRVTSAVLHFGVLAPLAFLGMWITRRRRRELWPLYAFAGVFALSVVAFYVLDRYRYPLVPVLVLFAGAALVDIGACWKSATGLERSGAVVLLAVASVACNWRIQSTASMQAVTHNNIGIALAEAQRNDEAEGQYRAAIALQPAFADPHTNLAGLLARKGDYRDSLSQSQEAVRLAPDSATAFVNLGVALGSLDRPTEAVDPLTRAVDLDPRNADGHYNLAKALIAIGKSREAEAELRETLRLDPSRAAAYNNLGVLLCSEGRLTEGVDALRTAVALDPGSEEAEANLQHALELAGEGHAGR